MRCVDRDETRTVGGFRYVSISDTAVTTNESDEPVAYLERDDQAWRVVPDSTAFAEIELEPALVK